MGIFSHKKSPNTAAQEAEAARQAAAEAELYRQRLADQERIAAEQRADADRRYQQQLADQTAENQRQREADKALLQQQIDARTGETNRQETLQRELEATRQGERTADFKRQEEKAANARAYAQGRNDLMEKGRADIDTAFAGFDDSFFDAFQKEFVGQYKPQAERAYQKERKGVATGFADAGNLRSSAAARSFGDLRQQLVDNEGKIAGAASDAGQSLRNDVLGQKSDALNLVFSAGGVGDMDLPDGVDAATGLQGLGDQIGALTTSAQRRAQSIKAPSAANANLNLNFTGARPRTVAV